MKKEKIDEIYTLAQKIDPKLFRNILIGCSVFLVVFSSRYIMDGATRVVLSYKGLNKALKS